MKRKIKRSRNNESESNIKGNKMDRTRMKNGWQSNSKKVHDWQPEGKRSRGKQKTRWKDSVIEEVRQRGAIRGRNIEELAQSFHQLKGRSAENSATFNFILKIVFYFLEFLTQTMY